MPRLGMVQQEIPQFLGVNLREERMDLADEELAKAINADLHLSPGTIVLRLGRSKQNSSALSDLVIRRITKANSTNYRIAGAKIYRGDTLLTDPSAVDLSSNLITTFETFRPDNDSTTWLFIADDAVMRKDDATDLRRWGITGPAAAATQSVVASGSLTGDYKARYTYVRKSGSNIAHESNPSAAPSATTLSSEKLGVAVVASSDGQVDKIRIYRTIAGGDTYLFDQEVDNTTATVESTQADTALTTLMEEDNDEPALASWCLENGGFMFTCRENDNKHYLRWSKRFRPESFPSVNFIKIGTPEDPLQCILPATTVVGPQQTVGMMAAFTRLTKFVVSQDIISGFKPEEALSHRGTPAPQAAIPTERGIIFVARDGIFATNLLQPDFQFAEKILALFFKETVNEMSPINWDSATKMSAQLFKNRYYMSYASGTNTFPDKVAVFSNDSKRWYFYDHPLSALYYEEGGDELLAGGQDGFVYVLEDGSTDGGTDITLDVQTKDYWGSESRMTRKLFPFFKVDTDPDGDSITADFFVDGVSKRSVSISGNRTAKLLRLPENTMGHRWRIKFSYTGSKRPRIYGCSAMYVPLQAA